MGLVKMLKGLLNDLSHNVAQLRSVSAKRFMYMCMYYARSSFPSITATSPEVPSLTADGAAGQQAKPIPGGR